MTNNDDIEDIKKINERIGQKLIITEIEKVKLNLNKIYNHLQLMENNTLLLIANTKEQTEVVFKYMCELQEQIQNELICDCDEKESCCNEADEKKKSKKNK